MKYNNNGVKVALTRKVEKGEKTAEASIYWRVTYQRKQKYYFTGLSYNLTDWEEFTTKDLWKHKDTKKTLVNYFDNVLKKAIDRLMEDDSFTLDALDRELKGGDRESVNDAFKAKIAELEEGNATGNASIYRTALNSLLIFAGYRKLRNREKRDAYIDEYISKKHIRVGKNVFQVPEIEIRFSEITPKFLQDWENFNRDVGNSVSYIAINMRTLRAVINNDGGKPYLEGNRYPYGKGKYVIPKGRRRKTYLPIADVWKMEDYHSDNDFLMRAKDMFLFMFFGSGMNIGDVCRLRYSDIQRTEIRFFREKTSYTSGDEPEPIYVPLLPPMIEIINRWGNKSQDGYIFPYLNGIEPRRSNEARIKDAINAETNRINSSLKVVATELELDAELSTNWARHSYMTHLLSELFLNDIIVKQMVGHSTSDDVTAGYNHLNTKKRREINERLLNPEKSYKHVMGSVV